MREIDLNGYIDEEVWYGDEITPESLHESLYGPDNEYTDDVHIRLNSCGGSCNAAVRMFDDIRAYPGSVNITVSGTAASAATMLCMAADQLEMTPGSLFMIHDPSMMAFGNEHDLEESIGILRACKESILNMYERRVRISRSDTAAMMTASTWMDASAAREYGFVDSIVEDPIKYPVDSASERCVNTETAKAAYAAWEDRKRHPRPVMQSEPAPDVVPENKPESEPESVLESAPVSEPESVSEPATVPEHDRIDVRYTDTRLNDLKY